MKNKRGFFIYIMDNTLNDFELLRSKEILAILDGDTEFGTINGRRISMPYLSGPVLCDISLRFGLSVTYGGDGGALSRWAYLDNLIAHCIKNGKMQQLLSFLFSKNQFSELLKGLNPKEIELTYNKIITKIIEQINGLLYFGGHQLKILNNKFMLRSIDADLEMETPAFKKIDNDYIKSLAQRASKDIEDSNFDSAITKCRTLLEEVFCYVIEIKGEIPGQNGDIGDLYKQVKSLYKMHPNKDADKRVNMLLSGLEKIITSITQMRNKDSDAHGVGSRRISISDHHARLFLNASLIMADFILSIGNKSIQS